MICWHGKIDREGIFSTKGRQQGVRLGHGYYSRGCISRKYVFFYRGIQYVECVACSPASGLSTIVSFEDRFFMRRLYTVAQYFDNDHFYPPV